MKRTKFDVWMAGICASRVCNGLVFMTYAAALPVLQKEWDMSAMQAGAIASGFQIGYAVSLVVFSNIADRISARTVYLGSLFAAGICSMCFALLARDFLSGLVLHTILGVALGGTYTTGVMIIADQYVPTSRGMAVGFFIASTSCGYALSLAISGIALPVGGYRLSFFLTCLGPVLAGVLAWITLRHTVVPVAERRDGRRFTREVLGNRPAMLLIWGYSFHNWELQGMWSWTPAFMAACMGAARTVGVQAASSAANIVALFHVVGLIASFSIGSLSDRFGRARSDAGGGLGKHDLLLYLRMDTWIPSVRHHRDRLNIRPFLPWRFPGPLRRSYRGDGAFLPGGSPRFAVPRGFRRCRHCASGVRRGPGLEQPSRRRTETLRGMGLGIQRAGRGRARCRLGYLPLREDAGL